MPRRYYIDRFDGRRLQEALKILEKVRDYNYVCESNPLYRKLDTVCRKMENLLMTELEPRLCEEYKANGKV